MPSVERSAGYVKGFGGHRSPRTGSCCARPKTKLWAHSRLHENYLETTFEELATQAAFADTEYQSRFNAIR